jgi:hypothetical protein
MVVSVLIHFLDRGTLKHCFYALKLLYLLDSTLFLEDQFYGGILLIYEHQRSRNTFQYLELQNTAQACLFTPTGVQSLHTFS